MDLNWGLHELQAECSRIETAIANLNALALPVDPVGALPPRSRRDRKSMGEAERREVSERMKSYWANRRKAGSVAR